MKHTMRMLSVFILFFLCISNVFAQQNTAPLVQDKAFRLTVQGVENNTVKLHWDIAKSYHLYRDKFSFTLESPSAAQIGQINLPQGMAKHDDILGDYQIYQDSVDIIVPFKHIQEKQVLLLVGYQGCSDNSFCYPPVTKKVTLDFQDLTHVGVEEHRSQNVLNEQGLSVQDKVTHLLEQKNYFWIVLAFIGFGILLAFTPCVLPMVPILSGIILGQKKKDLSTLQAFLLSLSYVLGMSVMYALAGILVAVLGSHLSGIFQAPWMIVLFSVLFFLLALSLFDLYQIRLPHFIQHRVLGLSHQQKSGSYIGAFVMGALSVLVVSPCVTAPLVGVLTFIAQTGDLILGSVALFALGIGMGLPLIIIGTTEGRLLPQSGHWMHIVKSFFGILLLMVSVSLLQRIFTGPQGLMLWSIFFIILSAYFMMGFVSKEVVHETRTGFAVLMKGIGYFLFSYGVILLIGASMGNGDFFHPLKSSSENKSVTSNHAVNFTVVSNFADLQKKLESARKQDAMVILDFYANWCVACHEMDRTLFSNQSVVSALANRNIILLRADITANSDADDELKKYFNVIAPPTLLFFDTKGKEQLSLRVVGGELSADDFLQHLNRLSNH